MSTPHTIAADFATFWAAYPRHEAKRRAEQAYRAARKKIDATALLDAVAAYRQTQTDPRFFAHAATWLNGERWADERPAASIATAWTCPHVPPCHETAFRCHLNAQLEAARAERGQP